MLYQLCAIITAISTAVSLGFAAQAYWQTRSSQTAAATTARYALSRSGALAIAAVGLLVFHSPEYLTALAVAMTFVQLFDGVIGRRISTFKTVGPTLTGVANAIVLALYLMQ